MPAAKTLKVFSDPRGVGVPVAWGVEDAKALFDFRATCKESTWKTYEVGLRNFFSFCLGLGLRSPRQVEITHITSYIAFLKEGGMAGRTINLYLSSASSFFDFMMQPRDTAGTSLIKSNPFHSVRNARPKIQPYHKETMLREMTLEEYRAILDTCLTTTVLGKRDRAILRLIFHTTRRRREIVNLRVGDFGKDGRPYVKFKMKGEKIQVVELLPAVMAEVEDYWLASGRGLLRPESPAFTATTDAGKHLLKARGLRARNGEGPLAASALDQMVKKRGRLAGLDGDVVHFHIHGIRHLAARTFRKMGMDVKEIKERLGHGNLNTTDTYLGAMERLSSDGLEKLEQLELGKGFPGRPLAAAPEADLPGPRNSGLPGKSAPKAKTGGPRRQ